MDWVKAREASESVSITIRRMVHRVTHWNRENKTAIPTNEAMVATKAMNSVNKTNVGLLSAWY